MANKDSFIHSFFPALVHAGKYTRQIITDTTKTKHNPEKQTTQYSKTKLAWFSRFVRVYDTQTGNEVGLFYNAPDEPTRGNYLSVSYCHVGLGLNNRTIVQWSCTRIHKKPSCR